MSVSPVIALRDAELNYRIKLGWFRSKCISALTAVSLDVFPGETLGIIGRNGSGKSSLLRVIAGIYSIDSGTISSDAGSIALMTLNLGLDGELSGRDNAVFGAMLLGSSYSEAIGMLDEVLDFSELGSAFENPVKTYSSGMYARLAFSISISSSPDVLLVDEVLSVGDERFRDKAYSAIRQKISSDQTTIFVSHNRSEVISLCDRAVLLHDGRIVASGEPLSVCDAYERAIAPVADVPDAG